MQRLTDTLKPLPSNSFCFCQICGYEGTVNKNGDLFKDICEFRMWVECDENDIPSDETNVFIACKSESCQKVIDNHERLYMEVPWGRGGISKLIQGQFMLLCGDCKNRGKDFTCHSNKQKTVGGEGLEVRFANLPIFHVRFCIPKGKNKGFHSVFPQREPPASFCDGYEKK